MGLDMYLEARKYVSKAEYHHDADPTITEDYKKVRSFFPAWAEDEDNFAGANVSMNIGYWRKANQIHNWFIQNCADGVDECQPIYVSDEKLSDLLDMVEALLVSRNSTSAKFVLPPASGFFFGSTEIDEFYWDDLARTKVILERALRLMREESCSIIYQASW